MKRLLGLVFVLGLLVVIPLAAQESGSSDVYIKTVRIAKILMHEYGYRVFYDKADGSLGDFYVPSSWFLGGRPKAEYHPGRGPAYPYFVVYYESRKFSHIKLFVEQDIRSPSWGVLRAGPEVKDAFKVEELSVEY
jgi:hypothetical protein